MTTITDDDRDKIRSTLDEVTLVHGVGNVNEHTACTIAAINLALTGELRDDDPADCICRVIRNWVIRVQDAMPVEMLAESAWRDLIPWIAGTKSTPEVERARVDLVVGWVWDRLAAIRDVLPESVWSAWDRMLTERTADAAYAAYAAAVAAADAAYAAYAAADAAYAAADAAVAAASATYASASAHASAAAASATYAAASAYAAYAAADATFWRDANPANLLNQLIHCEATP